MAAQALKVFVSSTAKDLEDYRRGAEQTIRELGWDPRMMEYFGASPAPTTLSACQEKLADCDVVLLLVAFQRGWVPTGEQGGNGADSITAHELAFARQRKIPVLTLMASETWPGNRWEADQEARDWVTRFRTGLNMVADFFDDEPPAAKDAKSLPIFRSRLRNVLVSHKERLYADAAAPGGVNYFESARRALIDGSTIPFIGPGVFRGPLSSDSLIHALGHEEEAEGRPCIATAAEYLERYVGGRERFLEELHRIVEAQSRQAVPTPVHDMIARIRLRTLPLIVSATFDLVLEQRLAEAGKSYAIVCHIVRSYQGQHDGEILVLRPGEAPEIVLADKLDVKGVECVIYKPLGSPLLHDQLDPALEIDTVVATETDHLTLLGRLANQHTQIPTAFHRIFQRRQLLFLGYPLDVWSYRLVVQVFESVDTHVARSSRLAVREPTSAMEELAWRRVRADLIHMEPHAFARQVLQSLQPETANHAA